MKLLYLVFKEILNDNINMNTFSFSKMLNDRAFAFDTKKFYNKVQNLKFNMQSTINNTC